MFSSIAVGKNIRDFANGYDSSSCICSMGKKCAARRRHGVVATVSRALKPVMFIADEGPRDDPTYAQRVEQSPRGLANSIEPPEAKALLMRRDLEHRVRRCVADRFPRADVFRSKLVNDVSARCVHVAERAREP